MCSKPQIGRDKRAGLGRQNLQASKRLSGRLLNEPINRRLSFGHAQALRMGRASSIANARTAPTPVVGGVDGERESATLTRGLAEMASLYSTRSRTLGTSQTRIPLREPWLHRGWSRRHTTSQAMVVKKRQGEMAYHHSLTELAI